MADVAVADVVNAVAVARRAATYRRQTVAVRQVAVAAGSGRERTQAAANRRRTTVGDCPSASRWRCANPRRARAATVKLPAGTTAGTRLRPPRSHRTLTPSLLHHCSEVLSSTAGNVASWLAETTGRCRVQM